MTVTLSKSRVSALVALAAISAGIFVAACSDSVGTSIQPPYDAGPKPTPSTGPTTEPAVDAGPDAEETPDAEAPKDATAPVDAAGDAAPAFAPCTQADFDLPANDHTGTGNQVDISQTGAPGTYAYVNPCSKIKAGGTADFAMNFTNHPLVPVAGSPTNPIQAQSSATDSGDYKVMFPTAGTYGFHCGFHSSMKGQILVVP